MAERQEPVPGGPSASSQSRSGPDGGLPKRHVKGGKGESVQLPRGFSSRRQLGFSPGLCPLLPGHSSRKRGARGWRILAEEEGFEGKTMAERREERRGEES